MKRLNNSAGFLSGFLIISSSICPSFLLKADENSRFESSEIEMYHCVEPNEEAYQHKRTLNASQQKMVFGHINGQRTECMSESEFHARFHCSAKIPRPPAASMRVAPPAKLSYQAAKNFSGSDFRDSDLFNMDFQFADCSNSDFSGADMRNAKLQGADCQGANFEGAFLKNANLYNADLSDANLKNAYFVSSDLRGVKGLTIEKIRLTATIYNCKLDAALKNQINMYCPSKYRDVSQNWGIPQDDKHLRVRRVSK
jgi:hypothetical protein